MPTSLGLVGIVDKGIYSSAATYVKGNFVYHNGSTWVLIVNTATNIEPSEANSSTWKYLAKGTIGAFTGATASEDGTDGLVPKPNAGDQDKVLQGGGTWGKKLQIDIVIQNNQYGYIGANNTFIPFKSQADIDAAVSAAKVGNATAADVLSGKTFTNSSTSGETGSMTNNGKVTPSALNCGGSYTIPSGYHNGQGVVSAKSLASQTGVDSGKSAVTAGAMVSGYQGWVNGNKISGTFEGQEKTVTAGTAAASVTPDSGKYLTKVTYNPTPSETKAATAGTSNVDVTPSSGKLMSKVTVSPTPTQSKSCSPSYLAQTVSPDNGKHLSSVSVSAMQKFNAMKARNASTSEEGDILIGFARGTDYNTTISNATQICLNQSLDANSSTHKIYMTIAVANNSNANITGVDYFYRLKRT